jgi:hypothetical protein
MSGKKRRSKRTLEEGIINELDIIDAMIQGLFACLEEKGILTQQEWDAQTIRKMKEQRGEYQSRSSKSEGAAK